MSNTELSKTSPDLTQGKLLPFKSIPIIDIAPLMSGSAGQAAATAAAIAKAAGEVGFFYIRNHGIRQEVIAGVYAEARRFHESPSALKERVHVRRSPGTRGWVPVSAEDDDGDPEIYKLSSDAEQDDFVNKPRLHAAFDIAIEIDQDDPDFLAGNVMLVPNQWPDWLPGFQQALLAYYAEITRLGDTLFNAFTIALQLPEDFFAKITRKPPSQMRILHYPKNDFPRDNNHLGIHGHSDMECFTILTADAPGLQVMNASDEWIDAPPIPDTFIVNIGDLLENWTNGLFKATQHRVVNTGEERYSIPMFFAADYDTIVEPLPQFVSDSNPPRYNSMVAGHHLAAISISLHKHMRRRVAKGEIKPNFKIYSENPFFRRGVDEPEFVAKFSRQ